MQLYLHSQNQLNMYAAIQKTQTNGQSKCDVLDAKCRSAKVPPAKI